MPDDADRPSPPRARTHPGIAPRPRDRDELSAEARAEHARAIPEYTGEDITGQVMALTDEEIVADDPDVDDDGEFSPEELAGVRARRLLAKREGRPTMQRVRHLERKMDGVVPALAHIKGQLEILPNLVRDAATAAREAATAANALASAHQRATVTTTIETGGAAEVGAIQVATAGQLEASDKRKTWREVCLLVLKVIVAALVSAAGIGEIVRQLGGG